MSLHLTPYWEAMASLHPDLTPARVISQERGMYRIQTAEGSMNASVSGKFQFESRSPSAFPAVGDYVMADLSDPDTVVIHAILPRKTLFLRQTADGRREQAVAANIDTAFLCVSMNADFNLRRLERYLAAARESGARPVIVFTKTDLIDFVPEVLEEVQGISGDADIVMTSIYGKDGYSQLLPYLEKGSTVVFVGSSGVGKPARLPPPTPPRTSAFRGGCRAVCPRRLSRRRRVPRPGLPEARQSSARPPPCPPRTPRGLTCSRAGRVRRFLVRRSQ